MTQLFATPEPVFQPGLRAMRRQYILGAGPGGGDGMTFVTGTESFSFRLSSAVGPVQPRAIISAWVDATNLTSGKNLILSTPSRKIVVAGGTQGYVILTLAGTGEALTVTTNGGTGSVAITLYDYNALFSGQGSGAGAPIASGSGGGSSGTVSGGAAGSTLGSGGLVSGGGSALDLP